MDRGPPAAEEGGRHLWGEFRTRGSDCSHRHLPEDGGESSDGPPRSPKRRKRAHPSEEGCAVGEVSGGEEPGPTGRTDVDSSRSTREKLVLFDGRLAFGLKDLRAAPMVFLGKGTYGTVYRATLADGSEVAVRRPSWAGITEEFEAEVKMLGRIRHPNLLVLRAYYIRPEKAKMHMVFDYMPRGSLSALLHGRLKFVTWVNRILEPRRAPLGPHNTIDWPMRKNILIGIARGLHYLHTQKNVVHGNLTSENILLDNHTNAKIADYGLLHLMTLASNSNVIPTAGASGYRAPELCKLKKPNTKTDVYSLGVIMLELLTGMSPREEIDGLHFVKWIAWLMKELQTDVVFDMDVIRDAVGKTRDELLDTLTLALRCVDPSPEARPESQEVLQQLEKINPELAGDEVAAATRGGDVPINASLRVDEVSTFRASESVPRRFLDTHASNAGSTNEAASATGCLKGVEFSLLYSLDMTEEKVAPPFEDARGETPDTVDVLASDGNLQSKTPTPINSCKVKVKECTKLTSKGDLKDGEISTPIPPVEVTPGHSGTEAMAEDKTGESISAKGTDAIPGDTLVGQLSSIDWAEVDIEAQLEVPSSPPLISSNPDLVYQRFFQVLHDLAHRSLPLPSDALEAQLNRMVIGLHSLGYPLEPWLKAATLLLVFVKKREYIEHHVDGYKANVEAQLAKFTSAITLGREEISRMQSYITTLEQKQEELHETITKLEDQLAVLKTQQEDVVDLLTMARDQLFVAVASMESVFTNMNRLNRQHSVISDLRSAMLRALPSVDEALDSSFQEIMTKKF